MTTLLQVAAANRRWRLSFRCRGSPSRVGDGLRLFTLGRQQHMKIRKICDVMGWHGHNSAVWTVTYSLYGVYSDKQ